MVMHSREILSVGIDSGTNPLEAGAYAVQLAQKMMRYKASGVKLRLAESS
jgi:ethanolamine ammonia-lyase small subunit